VAVASLRGLAVAILDGKRYVDRMTIEALKAAIAHLPSEDRTALAAWIIEQDMKSWDEQIEKDFSPGGKGMAMLDEVKADIRTGKFKPFEEGRRS
jgi:hypothetical protein